MFYHKEDESCSFKGLPIDPFCVCKAVSSAEHSTLSTANITRCVYCQMYNKCLPMYPSGFVLLHCAPFSPATYLENNLCVCVRVCVYVHVLFTLHYITFSVFILQTLKMKWKVWYFCPQKLLMMSHLGRSMCPWSNLVVIYLNGHFN